MPTVSDSVTIPDKIQIYFSTLVKVIRGFFIVHDNAPRKANNIFGTTR